MSLYKAFVAYLVSHPKVAGLIGARLYPRLIPENGQLPAMAYQLVSMNDPLAHDGAVSVVTRTYQFTCQAVSYNEAQNMAQALREALHGFTGPMGNAENTVQVSMCEYVAQDDGEAIEDATLTRCDFKFVYMEE